MGCSRQLPATDGGMRRRVPPPRLSASACPPTAAHLPPALQPPSHRRPPPRQRSRRSRPAAFPRSCRRLKSSRSRRRSCLGRKRPPCYFLPRKRLQAGPGPPRKEAAAAGARGAAAADRGRPRAAAGRDQPALGARGEAAPRVGPRREGRAAPGSRVGLRGFKRASLFELAWVCVPARCPLRGFVGTRAWWVILAACLDKSICFVGGASYPNISVREEDVGLYLFRGVFVRRLEVRVAECS